MKKFFFLLSALFALNCVRAQPCLPDGITFYSQQQIDNFQIYYPNCTEIEGNVIIGNANWSDITNLNGLSVLASIGGSLVIGGTYLVNLSGLNSLTSIGGIFQAYVLNDFLEPVGNAELTSLMGLDNLTTIGGNLDISNNNALTSITALDNLTSIGGVLSIDDNGALTNLTGLDNLTSIGGYLDISYNIALTSLTGLEGLTSIVGDLNIVGNASLTNLSGLNNINSGSIINLDIFSNSSLSSCEAQSICDYLANPNGSVNIYNNATGCNNPLEVASNCGIALPCLPFGNYYFLSQADIDNFLLDLSNCTELEGNVTISGSDITNLNGLNVLTSIGGSLSIGINAALTNLTGLDNLTSIGGDLSIYSNETLTSLTGLEGLTSIGGGLDISGSVALTSLTGLDNLTSIGGGLNIGSNGALIDLMGLEGLTSIGGSLYIGWNAATLTSLTGLNNLTSIGDYLTIDGNASLTNLSGLEGLTSVGGDVYISGYSLTNLTGLESLTSIGGYLDIAYTVSLTSITGLENVTSIGGFLYIVNNDALTSLTGLDNINAGSINDLAIYNNPSLSFCDVQSICNYLASPNGVITIDLNATGCSSRQEVEAACEVGVNDNGTITDHFTIYPNPASHTITISTPTTPNKNTTLTIFNINGQQLLSRQITEQQTVVDMSGLPHGVYLVKVTDESKVQVGKIIRQ
jgi:hypothetical protein